MDRLAYILHYKRKDAQTKQPWSSEIVRFIREFLCVSYTAANVFADLLSRPLPPVGHFRLYTAGPPCQGLSSAGLREHWGSPRTGLYMQAVHAIEQARPETLLVENSDNLRHASNGTIANATIARPRTAGYNGSDNIINTKDDGPPQFRARLWMVGILMGTQVHCFRWPDDIQPVKLGQLLIPQAIRPRETTPQAEDRAGSHAR